MIKKLFLTFAAVALAVACNVEPMEQLVSNQETYYNVQCAPYDNEVGTKSANFGENSQVVTNYNIWVYDQSGNGSVVNSGHTYFASSGDIRGSYLFPDANNTYDVFIFTNVGELSVPADKSAAQNYQYTFNSFATFATVGFPMASHLVITPATATSHTLLVQRLVSKYTVTFQFASNNNYTFNLESAVVKQSAKVIKLYDVESKAYNASDVVQTADYLSVAELQSHGGELYMLENIQGNVFPEGAIRNISNLSPDVANVATYLEFSGQLNKNDGTGYSNVTCRYYFGTGTFVGVRRNLNTNLILTLQNSILNNDEWQVEPQEPYNTGYIVFNPENINLQSNNEWNTFQTITYSASGINPNVKYTLEELSDYPLQIQVKNDDTWVDYNGEELTGPKDFRARSDYNGYNTIITEMSSYSSDGDILDNSLGITINPKAFTIDFMNVDRDKLSQNLIVYESLATSPMYLARTISTNNNIVLGIIPYANGDPYWDLTWRLNYSTTEAQNAYINIKYKKKASDSWADYTNDTVLIGQYIFQISTSIPSNAEVKEFYLNAVSPNNTTSLKFYVAYGMPNHNIYN